MGLWRGEQGAKEEAAFRKILTEANAAVKKGYDIVWVDAASNQGALQFFGLEEKDTPALTVHAPAEDAKYVKKNVAPKDVKPWITEYEVRSLLGFLSRGLLGFLPPPPPGPQGSFFLSHLLPPIP